MSKKTSISTSNDQMLQAMQQQFERMFRIMEGVNERLERHDGILNQLQGLRRQRRQPPIEQEEYDGRDDLEDDQITLVGHLRMQARRGCMEDVDHNLTSCSLPLCFIVRSWVRSFPMSTSVERVARS